MKRIVEPNMEPAPHGSSILYTTDDSKVTVDVFFRKGHFLADTEDDG